MLASGIVSSLARPGGSITGPTFLGPELSAKRLELLKEAVPRLARAGIVLNPGSFYHVDLERVKTTAAALNVVLSAAKGLPGAGSDGYAEGGGLLAYGVSFPELWRRAPYFGDRIILKGSDPATIPVEQASKFELVVNLRTARAMALPIRQSLLPRADQVIE